MATYHSIQLSSEGAITTITLNRESKLNALNKETISELKDAFQEIMDDKDIRGVLITGAGEKAFAAGADISEFTDLSEMHARKFAEEGQEVFQMIENCHTPVVAVVNGFALGGGCELAMACHMRIATGNAKFGQPEVNLGLIPGYGGTQRLTQLIGKGRAFELIMSARQIDAETAKTYGLVNDVAPTKEEAMDKAKDLLNTIAGKAPIAVGLVVDCVNAVYTSDDGYQIESNAFSRCFGTSDFKEGVDAFLSKRKADFKGE
jgi:enoyl-CoA hydratase